METRARIASLVLVAAFVFAGPSMAGERAFVGAKKCRPCHLTQYTSWEKTKMASLFDVLKPRVKAEEKKRAGLDPAADYTADSKCLACHTTGYGKPGGFRSLAATPDLVGIQCESCHGPASDYLAKDKMSLLNKEYKRDEIVAAGLVIPTAGTCTSACHNTKSPFMVPGAVFDFQKRKDAGTHEHIPLKYKH